MLRFRKMKSLAVLISISMLLGMINTNAYAKEDVTYSDHYKEKSRIQSFDMESARAVSGSAIYVGGHDGTDITYSGDGSKAHPYSTLKEVANSINDKGPGSYEVKMLGNTNEESQVVFGNGEAFEISITAEPVSGGAITVSKGYTSGSGSMISVNTNTTLTIEGISDTMPIIFDGGGTSYKGEYSLVMIMANGTLNLNANTFVQNNINTSSNTSYQGGGITNYGNLNINGGKVSDNECKNGGGIYNYGILTMNGGSVSGNNVLGFGYGGGINNSDKGNFTLRNGIISENNCPYGGSGIYNSGNLNMEGGSITKNSGYVFYNYGTVTMSGGDITANESEIIILNANNGTFNMTGGTISSNKTLKMQYDYMVIYLVSGVFNLSGGLIHDNGRKRNGELDGNIVDIGQGSFNMTGGTISNNEVSSVFRIWDSGIFTMSDGEISNNIGNAFDTYAPISLSDNASISGIDGDAAKIRLDKGAYINVSGSLSNITSFSIIYEKCREGMNIVVGPTLTEELLAKFIIEDTNYIIDNKGNLVFVGKPATFYVNKTGDDDKSVSGSSKDPLLTIQEAVDRIGTSSGTIIIQSDLDVVKPIYIYADITIKSDKTTVVINKKFRNMDDALIYAEGGSLTLGDKEQTEGELIIGANNKDSNTPYIIQSTRGTVNLYDRAVIRNDMFSRSTIKSDESVINIDGGSIYPINGYAIENWLGTVNLVSGIISADPGELKYKVGIYNGSGISTVNMSGGSITGFTGDSSCGIENEGIVNISGGIISNNTYSINNKGTLNMSQKPSIPIGLDRSNGIYLSNYDPINLKYSLSLSNDNKTLIFMDKYKAGETILTGNENAIRNNINSFILSDGNHTISEWGTIKYDGEPPIYYVDNTYLNSDSDGTSDRPFRTLKDAVNEIDNSLKVGIINICSDLSIDDPINDPINIVSDITLINYGPVSHTISSTISNKEIFTIKTEGSLTLGDVEGEDSDPNLKIYSGDSIGSYGIINNHGVLKLYAGVELHGNGTINSRRTGGVDNQGTFMMAGGKITNCTGAIAGAIYNASYATFIMGGGIIEKNNSDGGVAIYNAGSMRLSGDASIPMGYDGVNKLVLNNTSSIHIDTDLSTSENILLNTSTYIPGRQLLKGNDLILSRNYQKFILGPMAANYSLNQYGKLEYTGSKIDYYVDAGESGSDVINTGSKESPFATLAKAVAAIEDNGRLGTIHLCSDIKLDDTIDIYSTIKLVNEGETYTISRNPGFDGNMIHVYGQLELGNSELNGQPEISLLTISGKIEDEVVSGSIIYNDGGSVILNNGIVLEDNNSSKAGSAIDNYGSILMKSGVIQNNITKGYGAGIYNAGNIDILGGSIRNNEAMNGGGIYSNGGALYISDGSIHHNKASYGAGLALFDSKATMSGGKIFGNAGYNEDAFGTGVDIKASTFTVLGNASISSDNDVSLNDWYKDIEERLIKSYITVGDYLSEDIPTILVSKYYYSADTAKDEYYYPVGDLIVKPSTGYTLTEQDVSKFQMDDSAYAINILGNLSNKIKESWFSLVNAENIYYTGSESRPAVVCVKGATSLIEGRDYQVSYTNNTNVGTATVYITGTGNYGGTVIKTFVIHRVTYTITANAGKNGNITPSGNITVNSNANQSFSIRPAMGYTIAAVIVDEVNIGTSNTYTFTDVTGNHSISVTFKVIPAWPTPQPTPEPTNTPIPTPTTTPIPDIPSGPAKEIKEMDAKVSMRFERNKQSNTLNASIIVSPDSLESLSNTSEQTIIIIPIGSDELLDQMQDDDITGLNIDFMLPNELSQNDSVVGNRILLDPNIINTARDSGMDISISLKDEEGKENYSWSFRGSDLGASDKDVSELDLSISIQRIEDNEDLTELMGIDSQSKGDKQNGLVISFGYHGELPAQASVRIYIGNMGYSEGDRLYLYYYNSETGKLDTLPFSSNYKVDSEGYITVNIVHCSDYVLLPRQAKGGIITSLRNQITITPSKITLYLGVKDKNTANINLVLPETLEKVKNLKDKTTGSAIGAVKVTYKSGNKKIASVDSSGNIIAKKAGKVEVKVTITLYSGKSKTFKVPVIVKK